MNAFMNVGHENDEGVIHYLNRSQITFLVDKLKNFLIKMVVKSALVYLV